MPGPFAGFDVCNILRSSQTTSIVLGTGARSVADGALHVDQVARQAQLRVVVKLVLPETSEELRGEDRDYRLLAVVDSVVDPPCVGVVDDQRKIGP